MKKTIYFFGVAFLMVALIPFSASAQDLIVLKNAQEIEAKVTAVSQTDISYRKWNNLDGPLYTVSKNEVFYIKYENGEKEVMSATSGNSASAVTSGNSAASMSVAENGSFSSKLNPARAGRVTFDGYVNFDGYYSSVWAGPAIDVSLGVNLFDYGYVGFQTGFEYFFTHPGKGASDGYLIPIGLNTRGYLPCNGKTYPFVDWTIGACVGNGSCFHTACLVGCDFSRFSLGLGWDYTGRISSVCLKLGIRLGKIK